MISMQNYKKLLIYKPVAIKNLLNFRKFFISERRGAERKGIYDTRIWREDTEKCQGISQSAQSCAQISVSSASSKAALCALSYPMRYKKISATLR